MSRARLVTFMLFWALTLSGCSGVSPNAHESGAGGEGQQGGFGGAGGQGGDEGRSIELYVDPALGLDTSPGTEGNPLKTIGKALSLAVGGAVVRLAAGTYGATNGESFPVLIPRSVSLAGPESGVASIVGSGDGPALSFSGDGGAKRVRIEGFDKAIVASEGSVRLADVTLVQNRVALHVDVSATLTAEDVEIYASETALLLGGAAQLRMKRGSIHDTGPKCDNDGAIADVMDAASLTISNVSIYDNLGALRLSGSSSVHLTDVPLNNNGSIACGTGASILVTEAAHLEADHIALRGAPLFAVLAGGASKLSFHDSLIQADDTAVAASGAWIALDGSEVRGGPSGAFAGIVVSGGGSLQLVNSNVHHVEVGVRIFDASIRARGSIVGESTIGLVIQGSASRTIDLGTIDDPGNNLFDTNKDSAVEVSSTTGMTLVSAAHNTWVPNKQGVSPSGFFLEHGAIGGPLGEATDGVPPPRNFTFSTGVTLTY